MFILYAQFFYFWNILLIGPKTVNLDLLDGYFLICLVPVINFHKLQIAGIFKECFTLFYFCSLHHKEDFSSRALFEIRLILMETVIPKYFISQGK